MKKPYSDSFSYDYTKAYTREKKNTKPSMTVPDMNYTMREILNKFTSGQPINDMGVYKDYDYDNPDPKQFDQHLEEYLPHPKTLDLVERQELKEKLEKEQSKQKSHKKTQNDTKNQQQQSQPTPTDKEKT